MSQTPTQASPSLFEKADPIIVASFMRSGTHLTIDFLRRNFAGVGAWKWPGEGSDSLYLPVDCLADGTWSNARVQRVIDRSPILLGKVHWTDPAFQMIRHSPFSEVGRWLSERSRVIFVHRHPRKTIDSLIVWKLFTGELEKSEIPSDDWLIARLEEWKKRIEDWSGTPRPLLMFSADRILSEPSKLLCEMEGFLALQHNGHSRVLPRPLKHKWHSRWNRLLKFRPESTEILTMRPSPSIHWGRHHIELMIDKVGDISNKIGYNI